MTSTGTSIGIAPSPATAIATPIATGRRARVLRLATAVALVFATLGIAGCTGPKFRRGEVPGAITAARAALDEGNAKKALKLMRGARKVKDLPTETRNEVQSVLELAAQTRIDELSAPGQNPEALVDLVELDLPRQIAVTAGLLGARRMQEKGQLMKAFEVVKKMDTRYPTHHERAATGRLVADIGFALRENPGRFLWWKRTSRPISVLEYLVINYPSEPRCDDAYIELAEIYENKKLWALAIERHENLLLYHPLSPHVPYSAARVPHLRLISVASPEYDRKELIRAREELENWDHDNRDLEHQVALDLNDCLRRLAENDLTVARFYRRVDLDEGVRYHAARALETARLAKDEARVRSASALLEDLPAAKPRVEPEDESPAATEPQASEESQAP